MVFDSDNDQMFGTQAFNLETPSDSDFDLIPDLHINSKFTIYDATLSVDDLVTPSFKKVSRVNSLIGLTGVIQAWGLINPIHVLKLEDDNAYLLLDGLRRVFGALRGGQDKIPARVWDFEDKEEGKSLVNILSLMINRSQKFSSKEIWEQMQILELVNGASPGLIEFLLQLNSGDAMKLKDIMLSDIEYSEIRENLMFGSLTIDQAYKKLTSERRKENRLLKEDSVSLDPDNGVLEDSNQRLSVDAVKDLLDLTNEDVGDASLSDLDRSDEARGEYTYQDTKDRKPVDPAIKQAVLIRDNFRCRCCGIGGHEGWSGVIVYHHIVPVFLHGPDSVDNGLSLCSNCHLTLHLYAFGKINVRLDELSPEEQAIFRNIFKYGNIIIEGMKRAKIDRDTGYRADSGSRRHLYPGEGLKDNKQALQELEKLG